MRLIVQRVRRAEVRVGEDTVGRIGRGMLVLVGVEKGDEFRQATLAADRLEHLRIFDDRAGKMNLDARSAAGEFLIVSQFTLAGSLAKGRRPSFDGAAPAGQAAPLVDALAAELERRGLPVARGRFGAVMEVEVINDGPVTFVLEIPPPP